MQESAQKPPLLYTIRINKAQSIQLAAYGTILFFLAAGLFSWITGQENNFSLNPFLSLGIYFAAMIAHEGVHGFFFTVFGGKPQYGVGVLYYVFPYAYATSPGHPYTFWQMFIIGLSPFFIISAITLGIGLALPALATYVAIAFVGNFAGAIGDLWLMRQLWHFRKANQLTFVDIKTGVTVHGTDEQAKAIAAKLQKRDTLGSKGSGYITLALTVMAYMFISGLFFLVILAAVHFKGHILIGPHKFPLFEFETHVKGASFTLNPVPALVASLLFTVLYKQSTKHRP